MPRDHRLYLDDILGAIDRIQSYVEGMDYTLFAADQRTMDAVIRTGVYRSTSTWGVSVVTARAYRASRFHRPN